MHGMWKWITCGLVVICGLGLTRFATGQDAPLQQPPDAPAAGDSAPQPPDFTADVFPILQKYCAGCHNADDAQGKLVMDSYDTLVAGGEHGAVVASQDAARSRLVLVLEGKAQPAMPPEGSDPPTPAEVAILKAWIDAGAAGPAGQIPGRVLPATPKIPLQAAAKDAITALAYSADGAQLAVARYSRVQLLNAADHTVVREFTDLPAAIFCLGFSANSELLYAAGGEPGLRGEARVWRVADGSLAASLTGHKDTMDAAALSPDGKLLATGSYDQSIRIWDLASGQEVRQIAGHNGAICDLAFSPNGEWLASASADRSVKLWKAATGDRLDTFGQPLKEVYAVAFSPDGTRLVAAGADNRIRVWQLSAAAVEGTNPLVVSRFAHEGAILQLVFSKDGSRLISTAEDKTVKVWDGTSLTQLYPLANQPDWAVACDISPDGQKFSVARLDGTLSEHRVQDGSLVPPPAPELAAIPTWTIDRGALTQVILQGKYLSAVEQVVASDPRIQITLQDRDFVKGQSLTVSIHPALDTPRGSYTLAALSAGGRSNELPLTIDNLPQHAEQEPNDSRAQPNLIAAPGTVAGVLAAAGDADYYAVAAAPGKLIVLDVAAQSIGSKADIGLTLFSQSGAALASANDFDGSRDPVLTFVAPAEGVVIVAVTDVLQTGSAEHTYRLSIGELPLVTGVFPLSIPKDTAASVELLGYNLPEPRIVQLPASSGGDVAVPIDAERFRVRRPLQVQVGSLPEIAETEPNDQPQFATALNVPGSANGRVAVAATGTAAADGSSTAGLPPAAASDVDLYRFQAQAGETWILETTAASRGSPLDTVIDVLDAAGVPVPRVQLQATRDSYLEFRSITSDSAGGRLKNWEEMDLNQFLYVGGEVAKLFRAPQGPDSEYVFYTINGKRRGFFDTSSSAHAVYEPCYIVEPHPVGAALPPNGLPVFTLNYHNDDDGERKQGSDSRIYFEAPATGEYLVRVTDIRGYSGDRFVYRLTVRRPEPDFEVTMSSNPNVPAGSARRISFNVNRVDGYEGPIELAIDHLPAGWKASSPLVVEAGQSTAQAVLYGEAGTANPSDDDLAQIQVTAKAQIGERLVSHALGTIGKIQVQPAPQVRVVLEPSGLSVLPGQTITAMLRVERNGYDGSISFDVDNLPHGVIVDNIGLNGVLIPEGMSERQIFLTAAKGVPPSKRQIHAVTREVDNQASLPIWLEVLPQTTAANP